MVLAARAWLKNIALMRSSDKDGVIEEALKASFLLSPEWKELQQLRAKHDERSKPCPPST